MGTVGSGWSTAWARIYLSGVLVGYLLWYDRRHRTRLLHTPIQPDLRRIRRFIALGFPAAMQITLEIGVFALVTALIGRLGAVALASHQIALNTVSITYMVPLGISSAAAVRVGQAIGRKDLQGAGDAGGTAIFLGAAFMTAASIILLVFPRWLARAYTPDKAIIRQHDTLCSRPAQPFSSLMAFKPSPPARCAAWETRALPCSAISPLIGLSVCRSAHGSAFAADGEPSASGPD